MKKTVKIIVPLGIFCITCIFTYLHIFYENMLSNKVDNVKTVELVKHLYDPERKDIKIRLSKIDAQKMLIKIEHVGKVIYLNGRDGMEHDVQYSIIVTYENGQYDRIETTGLESLESIYRRLNKNGDYVIYEDPSIGMDIKEYFK